MQNYFRNLDIKSVYDGDVTRALIYSSDLEPHTHIIRAALAYADAGKGGKKHYHPDTSEIYLLLEGQAIVEIDNKEVILNPMSCIQIPCKTFHRIRATNNSGIKYLAMHVSDINFTSAVIHSDGVFIND